VQGILKLAVAAAFMVSSLPATAAVAAETREPTPAGLAFGPCPTDLTSLHPHLTCARLDVPLDYARPSGEKVSLLVSKAASPNPAKRRGVLLVNPGGPGGSGSEWAGRASKPNSAGSTRLPRSVLDAYDVIGMDPRGVAYSTPVSCVDGSYYTGPRPDPGATGGRLQWWAFVDGIAAGCGAKSPQLLPYVGTRNVARDMDEVRKGLGEEKISYVGSSYGTYLGAVYATLFPNRVDRMILDSAIDPTPDRMNYDNFLAQDISAETRRTHWFNWIAPFLRGRRPGLTW
jgi:pimeloyl-ACP methyl ester carboxylesterase